jgi:cytochrome c2
VRRLPTRRLIVAPLSLTLALLLWPSMARAEKIGTYFKKNCNNCHSIGGGRLIGPDLKNVEKRKTRDWLIRFIQDPNGMIDSGDPYAKKLLKEARGKIMPKPPGASRALAVKLLDLIAAESKLKRSRFSAEPMRPFVPQDIVNGRNIIMGTRRLNKGGVACISCHQVGALGFFGGGTIGPDLSNVYGRYRTRRALAAWLGNPPTPVMKSVFSKHKLTPEEILALVAYFRTASQKNSYEDTTSVLNFSLTGLVGAILLLLIFGVLWRRRFRAVRREMVAEQARRIR